MFGKQKNFTKEITDLSKHHIELRRKLFAEISLELAKLELAGAKKDTKFLANQFYTALTTKYNNWSLEELGAILNSLKSPTTNFTRAYQVGIVFNKRHIAHIESPEVFEIQNLTLPKKIHHNEFECKDFALEEITFMTLNHEIPISVQYLKLYVLVNTNTQEIYGVMPTNHQFHAPHNGIFTLLDTGTFPNSHRFVLGSTVKISSFKHLEDVQGSKIILDTKRQTITKLGANKIQNIFTSKDGRHTAFSLLRPTKIFTRQYIDLASGKYIQAPMLALTEPTASCLSVAKQVETLKKLSGTRKIDPFILANTFRSCEKFDGKSVPATHFVVQNSLGETFLTGKANLNPKELPIIKTESGRLVVQVDYPQSIISEEVYSTKGHIFNKRYFDYKGHRLETVFNEKTTYEIEKPKPQSMIDEDLKLDI